MVSVINAMVFALAYTAIPALLVGLTAYICRAGLARYGYSLNRRWLWLVTAAFWLAGAVAVQVTAGNEAVGQFIIRLSTFSLIGAIVAYVVGFRLILGRRRGRDDK